MNDRASHRAAVEAGYADLASYVAKYRDEAKVDRPVAPLLSINDLAAIDHAQEREAKGQHGEPEYPGASIRTFRMVRPSTGERGEVRLMDYGSDSKTRYRVAAFCPGRIVELPGDTPKVEPEADIWCVTLDDASAWFELYVDRERRDGWKLARTTT